MRLETPVDFESVDDQPVDLVMMLLAPMGAGADHLKALSRVARILRTEAVRRRAAPHRRPARIYAILTRRSTTTRPPSAGSSNAKRPPVARRPFASAVSAG